MAGCELDMARLRLRLTAEAAVSTCADSDVDRTQAGHPGRVFRIPACVLVHLGGHPRPIGSISRLQRSFAAKPAAQDDTSLVVVGLEKGTAKSGCPA